MGGMTNQEQRERERLQEERERRRAAEEAAANQPPPASGPPPTLADILGPMLGSGPGTGTPPPIPGDPVEDIREDNPFGYFQALLANSGLKTGAQGDAFTNWSNSSGWSMIQDQYNQFQAADPNKDIPLTQFLGNYAQHGPAQQAPAPYRTGYATAPGFASPVRERRLSIQPYVPQQQQQKRPSGDASNPFSPAATTAGSAGVMRDVPTLPAATPDTSRNAYNPVGETSRPKYGAPLTPPLKPSLFGGDSSPVDKNLLTTLQKTYLDMTPQQRGVNSATGFKPGRWAVY
jgi:hypothetical protein